LPKPKLATARIAAFSGRQIEAKSNLLGVFRPLEPNTELKSSPKACGDEKQLLLLE
jgi:hypothetical protein